VKAGMLRTAIKETQLAVAYFNLEVLHITRGDITLEMFLRGMRVFSYRRIVPEYCFSYEELFPLICGALCHSK
jgi:hypothetical protein